MIWILEKLSNLTKIYRKISILYFAVNYLNTQHSIIVFNRILQDLQGTRHSSNF